jgi:hypothetical protein
VNTGAPSPSLDEAKARVLGIQTKLHRWATADVGRRFDDLFNLVTDPAFLAVAWERVRTNRGARTARVDGSTAHYIRSVRGEEAFLADLRANLKAGEFVPLPVAERMIPKSGGRLRRLGIPTVTDRVVQSGPEAGARTIPSYETLAAVGASVVEGLALRQVLVPEVVNKPIIIEGPDGPEEWHLAALGFFGVLEQSIEPDPDYDFSIALSTYLKQLAEREASGS